MKRSDSDVCIEGMCYIDYCECSHRHLDWLCGYAYLRGEYFAAVPEYDTQSYDDAMAHAALRRYGYEQ